MLYVRNKIAKPFIWLFLILLGLLNLYPFVYMLLMSLKTNEEIILYTSSACSNVSAVQISLFSCSSFGRLALSTGFLPMSSHFTA